MSVKVYIVAIVLAAIGASARADNEPWKQGVTADEMQTAHKLLDEGNTLLLERDYPAALAKYQDAIKHWDHPGIRFNIVRCLVQLDRTLEAVDNLELALRYGAAPLEETVYGEALAYQKMLGNQVATVSVECEQPALELTVDGQPLGTCPGKNARRVLPGRHQVVGKRAGYLTRTVELFALGGKTESVRIALDPLAGAGKVVHRWSTWVPWTVVGGGVLAAAVGGLVEARAVSNRDTYSAAIAGCGSTGCDQNYRLDLKDRAVLENRTAIGLFLAGGAAVITGGAMLYLNRGHTVYPNHTEQLVPTASLTAGGAIVGIAGEL